jgi:ABC-type multidrug transport system ATPase subunit
MKCLDLLVFLGEIRGVPRAEARRRGLGWLERLGLPEWADRKVEDLSKGMQQKVQFIGTVIHEPELLILDEPFSGLDPINQDLLEEIVLDFRARGTTILFSTHLMDQAERLCERVCLISRSRKVLDGDLSALRAAEWKGVVALEFNGPEDWVSGPEIARDRAGERRAPPDPRGGRRSPGDPPRGRQARGGDPALRPRRAQAPRDLRAACRAGGRRARRDDGPDPGRRRMRCGTTSGR